MKKLIIAISIMACAATGLQAQTILSGSETGHKMLTKNNCYVIRGCYVIPAPYTLTIQEGTVIMGEKGSDATLVIEPGAKIIANGTISEPIIFTSDQTVGNRAPQDWEGIVIGGNSTYNNGLIPLKCSSQMAGGTTVADSSGSMKYVQIHYAGNATNNLLSNALSLVAVGSKTVLEHLEITNSRGNGLGLIAGTVHVHTAYLLDNYRNDLFISDGYQGSIQGVLAVRNNTLAHDAAGSNGVYLQNNLGGTTTTPLTKPLINNCSFLGIKHCNPGMPHADFKNGIMFDRNSGGDVYNTVIAGYKEYGLFINDALSATRTANDELNFSYNSLINNGIDDYANGAFTWSSYGCSGSLEEWIEELTSIGCEETGNQFSSFTLGYDPSFCGDYCSTNFSSNFVLDATTALEDPNYDDLDVSVELDYRGAVQDVALFDSWITVCPHNQVYCSLEMKKEVKDKKSSLMIIPNPAKNQSHLVFDAKALGQAKVLILDKVTGHVLYRKEVMVKNVGEQTISIQLKALTEGVYPIRVEMKDAVINGMISVQ